MMISLEVLENKLKSADISILLQIKLNKDEKLELARYAKYHIPRASRVAPDLKLSLALVVIARQIYDQGNFWGNLASALNIEISPNKASLIGQIFLATIRKYNLFEIEKHRNVNEYVQNILAHCFVPQKYRENYYEFLYSFYDRNLGRVLPDNIDEDIQDLRHYMKKAQHTQDEELHLAMSKNHAAVSYKLIKSSQTVIAECDNKVINDEIIYYLSLIDDYFYNNSTEDMPPKLLKWCEEKFEQNSTRFVSNYRNIPRFRNATPFIGYDIQNKRAYIVIPERKFSEDTTAVELRIDKDGQEYVSWELELCQAYGCVKSDSVEFIEIGNGDIFSEFKIYFNNKLVKVIDKNNFRMFQEIKNNHTDLCINYYECDEINAGEICLLVPSELSVEVSGGIFLYKDFGNLNFKTYIVNVEPETVILIDGVPFNYGDSAEKDEPYKIFFDSPYNFIIKDENGAEIQSVYSHPKIYFKNPDEFLEANPFIWCNNLKFNLKENVNYKKLSEDLLYAVIDLQNLAASDIGEYIVQIDIPGKNGKSVLCKYLLIEDLEFITNRDIYAFENTAVITKNTGHYIMPKNAKKIKGEKDKYEFDLSDGFVVEFEIELAENIYTINIELKVLEYSFDGKRWFWEKKEYIWDNELKNFLYVRIPTVKEACLYLSNDSYYPIHSKNRNKYLEFDITKITEKFEEGEAFNDVLNIQYRCLNKIVHKAFGKIINQIDIKSFELGYDKEAECVYIDTEFYSGKYKFYVELENIETAEVTGLYLENGKNDISDLDSQGVYNITQYMEKKNMFSKAPSEKIMIGQILKKSPINIPILTRTSQIIIKDLYFENVRYPLNYNYQIAKVRSYSNYLWGVLYQGSKSQPVIFDFVDDENSKIYFKLSSGIEFCYDTEMKGLISSKADLADLHKNYSRYLFLDSENTYFNVTIKENMKDY